MQLTPDYSILPSPGTTMTPALLHALVDQASLTRFTSDDLTEVSGALRTSTNVSGTHQFLTALNDIVWYQNDTPVSLSGDGMRTLLGKADLVYYDSPHGHTPVRGLPCMVPHFGDHSRGSWSGWSCYSLAAQCYIPRITLDQILQGEFHGFYSPNWYGDSVMWNGIHGVVDETVDASSGLVKMVTHGFARAFVHASLSNELTLPHTVYGIQWNQAHRSLMPVSMNYTDLSQVTMMEIPLGLVRKVYTESGITLVPMIYENEVSATNCPYYVAEVFLGGFPCL